MLTKILSFFILLSVSYGTTVFLAPNISSRIDDFLGMSGLSEKLRWTKEQVDFVSTDGVNSVFESATRLRDDARWVVDSTKDRIDTVREQTNRVQETFEEAQETLENLREVYDSTSQSIEDISWTIRGINPNNQTSTGSEN